MNVPTTTYTYTSLKDFIMHKNFSMNEITLKNHVLKQAAIAYLKPLSYLTQQDNNNNNNKGFFDKCFKCGGSGGAESGRFDWVESFVKFICGRSKGINNEDKFE